MNDSDRERDREMEEGLLERERRQMEEIRQLDMEELQIEEVDFDQFSSSSDDLPRCGFISWEGLPLRVIQYRFICSLEKALSNTEAPCTVGVVRFYQSSDDTRYNFGAVGTTAEIRQYRRLEDGSINVVTRGQQRFRLRRRFIDDDGTPCAEVQIIEEEAPPRTPRDAFAQLAAISNPKHFSNLSPIRQLRFTDAETDLDQTPSSNTPKEKRRKRLFGSPSSDSTYETCEDESDEEGLSCDMHTTQKSRGTNESEKWKSWYSRSRPKCTSFAAPMSYWPRWVYDMYDSYSLARRAADLWREIIGKPSLEELVRRPENLSFYVASKMPISETRRQELLEMNGISYRLRREIQLLRDFNHLRCRNCLTLIAKRSDMVTMSNDGPLNAYVNPHGYVHEVITVYHANGLALMDPLRSTAGFLDTHGQSPIARHARPTWDGVLQL
ncbi:Protein cereblon [Carex littledalei]|uniref:Protein cereblon n=1 Tax=Carex littledalei TaxID=544730 RepID=A0A833RH45_9POAL|nr:Protein cereblon [Carex littledalei]